MLQNSTYEDIITTLCKDIAVDTSSLTLTRVDALGWHCDIVKMNPDFVEISLIDLQMNDIISVNRLQDAVGPRKYVKSIKSGRTASVSEWADQLMERYCGWRPIKGDGNCYYRAVYYGLFEQLIYRKRFGIFKTIHAMFSTLRYEDADEQNDHSLLLDVLLAASK